MNPNEVYVIGHTNPDTDSVVAAVVGARLLDRVYVGRRHQALMQGPATPQTCWLFDLAGVEMPPIRTDLRPTAGESCVPAMALGAHESLGTALDRISQHGFSIVPVVDSDGVLLGAVGHTLPGAQYLSLFNMEDFVGYLCSVSELVRGLGLAPLNNAARTLMESAPQDLKTTSGGSFRIFTGSGSINRHSKPGPGDVVLADHEEAVAVAADCAAVVLAGEAKANLPDAVVPVFHYAGSLMALITQLPRAIPLGRICADDVPRVAQGDLMENLRPVFARTPHALPVVDHEGRLCGMVSRREALEPPRPRLVLVDHFEETQSPRGWEVSDIVEIIDHHRVGALQTHEPGRIDCRPVGSTATILSLRFDEAGLVPDRTEALLLLGALLADTLSLRSPTTTETDRRVAGTLAELAGVEQAQFGLDLLRAGDVLTTLKPEQLVLLDIKRFHHQGIPFLIGQIETTNLAVLTPSLERELLCALEQVRQRESAAFAMTLLTDVLIGESCLLVADPDPGRQHHVGPCPSGGMLRMVSRKKELLPHVMKRLSDWKS